VPQSCDSIGNEVNGGKRPEFEFVLIYRVFVRSFGGGKGFLVADAAS